MKMRTIKLHIAARLMIFRFHANQIGTRSEKRSALAVGNPIVILRNRLIQFICIRWLIINKVYK